MTQQQTPPTEAGFFTTIRGWGITRSDARVLSGVVGGVAERLGWSRAWTRVGVVALAVFLNGIVLLAYGAAWALLPDRHGRIVAQDFGRGMPNVGALVGIGIFGVLGLIGLGDRGGPWGWSANTIWNDGAGGGIFRLAAIMFMIVVPIVLVGGVIFFIVMMTRRNRDQAAQPPGEPPVYAVPPVWAADRRAQRAAARHHQRSYQAASVVSAVDDAVNQANAAAEQASAAAYASAGYAAPAPAQPTGTTPPPAASSPVAPPPAAPRPPRPPRVPGPGAPFWLATLAWLVLSAAGTVWAAWQDRLGVHPMIAWFVGFVTGLGVILMLVALSGRRLGFLGFVSAVLLVPTLVLIGDADRMRDGWADRYLPDITVDANGVHAQIDGSGNGVASAAPVPAPTATATFDPLTAFEADYSTVTLPAYCYETSEVPSSEGQSRGLVSEVPLEQSVTDTLSAGYTTVRVPVGASVEVAAASGTSASVYFADRRIACDVDGSTGLKVANAGDPLLTLDSSNPAEGYSVIVIEEVAP
ncbi:PspC domain-containing protein [Demequina soli]|uniref:PspC domain-containing protein n=1 Tax=Demequina soli TaxID=1638987 RepID=UPI0007823A7F|nr:PspC domain-containing protein [Demequina soli]